jgi:hypothetical protein
MTQPVASCFTFAGLHLLHMRAVVSTVGDVASKDTDSVEQIAEDVSNACQDGSQQARAVVKYFYLVGYFIRIQHNLTWLSKYFSLSLIIIIIIIIIVLLIIVVIK